MTPAITHRGQAKGYKNQKKEETISSGIQLNNILLNRNSHQRSHIIGTQFKKQAFTVSIDGVKSNPQVCGDLMICFATYDQL